MKTKEKIVYSLIGCVAGIIVSSIFWLDIVDSLISEYK